jgi:hypothetical protein
MKQLFTLFAILIAYTASAQNYNCIQPGEKPYFINEKGYLRGIRIDSLTELSDHKIYYPYHTPRGYSDMYFVYGVQGASDTAGGSWLGKKIIIRNDGTYLFDTYFGDTVVIKTQASVGESWVFFNDTSLIYYKATITSKSTRIINDILDSVKVITVKAYHQLTGLINDPVNSLRIVISKNHGFYEAFDLHMFPHRRVQHKTPTVGVFDYDTFDYFFEQSDKQQFYLTELYIPRNEEFYNFKVGDIFRSSENITTTNSTESIYYNDTVISIDTSLSYRKGYRIKSSSESSKNTLGTYVKSTKYHDYEYFIHYGMSSIFDTTIMPEEYGNKSIYHYLPNDSSFCTNSPKYSRITEGRIAFAGEYIGCTKYEVLKFEFGSIKSSLCREAIYSHQHLMSIKRNSGLCQESSTTPISAAIIIIKNKIKLYPNPANDVLKIELPNNGAYSISILSYVGQIVYQNDQCTNNHTINTENLPTGLYVVYIIDKNGSKTISKLSITH